VTAASPPAEADERDRACSGLDRRVLGWAARFGPTDAIGCGARSRAGEGVVARRCRSIPARVAARGGCAWPATA